MIVSQYPKNMRCCITFNVKIVEVKLYRSCTLKGSVVLNFAQKSCKHIVLRSIYDTKNIYFTFPAVMNVTFMSNKIMIPNVRCLYLTWSDLEHICLIYSSYSHLLWYSLHCFAWNRGFTFLHITNTSLVLIHYLKSYKH